MQQEAWVSQQMRRLSESSASNTTSIKDLQDWQTRQNGSLQRLEAKVDKLLFVLLAACLASLGSFAGIIATLLSIHTR